MSTTKAFIATLLVLLLGAGLVLFGDMEDDRVGLDSVMEMWGDVLRDVDKFGLQLTRVSAEKEMKLGREINASAPAWFKENADWSAYVQAVGASLIPHVNREAIKYHFGVVELERVNAFALPGGNVYVTTGMLEFVESEAELAAIIGHEIAHVDLYHCIERYQYQMAARRLGAGQLGGLVDITRMLLSVGYNKYQEIEADAHGLRLSIMAGYDPEAGQRAFNRLAEHLREAKPKPARTIGGEVAGALAGALGSYFDSHPRSADRARRLEALLKRNRKHLAGETFYIGRENLRQRIPRSQEEFPNETRGW